MLNSKDRMLLEQKPDLKSQFRLDYDDCKDGIGGNGIDDDGEDDELVITEFWQHFGKDLYF